MSVLMYRESATGNFVPLPSSGMSQADADARYLQLTGGTITGDLTSASSDVSKSLRDSAL